MFTSYTILGVKVEAFTRETLPFFGALFAVLALMTFVCAVVTWLPNLLMGP